MDFSGGVPLQGREIFRQTSVSLVLVFSFHFFALVNNKNIKYHKEKEGIARL